VTLLLPATCVAFHAMASQVHHPDAVTFISQELYRAALFGVFFAQVLLAGALPVIGALLGGRRLAQCAWIVCL
jgi:hypothetical protein